MVGNLCVTSSMFRCRKNLSLTGTRRAAFLRSLWRPSRSSTRCRESSCSPQASLCVQLYWLLTLFTKNRKLSQFYCLMAKLVWTKCSKQSVYSSCSEWTFFFLTFALLFDACVTLEFAVCLLQQVNRVKYTIQTDHLLYLWVVLPFASVWLINNKQMNNLYRMCG